MKKMEMRSTALVLLLALSAFGQVRVNFKDEVAVGPGDFQPTVVLCNESDQARRMEGWRFKTRDFSGYFTTLPGLTYAGTGPIEYTHRMPSAVTRMAVDSCWIPPTEYGGVVPMGKDATIFDPQALVKTGSCNTPPAYQDAAPLSCTALDAVAADASYYGNRCLETDPGTARNRLGGFIATFEGQTQIQAAIPSVADNINAMRLKWGPGSLGGPQYMMALAMAQEIMNVDMRLLAAVGGKEMFFGFVQEGKEDQGSVSEWAGVNRDGAGTFSPWQIEAFTFARLMLAYPRFFPKYGPCLNRYPDLTTAIAPCMGSVSDPAAFYMRTPGLIPSRTGANSPQLANSVLVAALNFSLIHDVMIHGTDLYYSQALASAKDPRLALAAIIPAYNMGMYAGFANPLRDPAIVDDPSASTRFSTGISNYRPDIFTLLDRFTATATQSTACGGSNAVYDTTIGFAEIQRFFFGGGTVPGTPQTQGDGGLLLHFDLPLAERHALLAALQCGFARLKGKAPSTSGMDAISYRYDWLSILRVAKAFLPPLDRGIPVETDFNTIVQMYSTNPKTASGKTKDVTYPRLTVVSPRPGHAVSAPDSLGFPLTLQVQDDSAEVRADWSLDEKGDSWVTGGKSTGGNISFRIPCSAKGFPAPGRQAALWVKATDGCGNATVQNLEFSLAATAKCGDPVHNRPKAVSNSKPAAYRVEIHSGGIRIHSHPDLRRAIYSDVRGRILP